MKTVDYPRTVIDPVITEAHRHKQEIAGVFGFDVVALGGSWQCREAGDNRFKTHADEQIGHRQQATPAPCRHDPLDHNF